jgi:hypothetical protein
MYSRLLRLLMGTAVYPVRPYLYAIHGMTPMGSDSRHKLPAPANFGRVM